MPPEPTPPQRNATGWIFKRFERAVISALAVLMGIIVVITTIELGWLIARDLLSEPAQLLQTNELLEIFGFFLLVLIGLELLETIKAYLEENVIHVEVVLEVAMIAMARKVIALDLSKYSGLSVVAIGVLLIALAFAFYMERRSRTRSATHGPSPHERDRT